MSPHGEARLRLATALDLLPGDLVDTHDIACYLAEVAPLDVSTAALRDTLRGFIEEDEGDPGKEGLSDESRRAIPRCAAFLRTDYEYCWPVPFGRPFGCLGFALGLVVLAVAGVQSVLGVGDYRSMGFLGVAILVVSAFWADFRSRRYRNWLHREHGDSSLWPFCPRHAPFPQPA